HRWATQRAVVPTRRRRKRRKRSGEADPDGHPDGIRRHPAQPGWRRFDHLRYRRDLWLSSAKDSGSRSSRWYTARAAPPGRVRPGRSFGLPVTGTWFDGTTADGKPTGSRTTK